MKIVKANSTGSAVRPVGEMPHGTVVVNGEGNICMVCRPEEKGPTARVRIVNLGSGAIYSAPPTCRYEEVDATLTWQYTKG